MRVLLIHNDNLNQRIINSFDEDDTLIFSIPPQTLLNPNFSFDKEAHEQLEDHFEEYGNYDLIVLPFNLSQDNYLEFTGIQLANHIRLTKVWNHQKTPILFIGEETPAQIASLMRADILFTKGVFCTTDQTFDEITRWANKLDESKFEISEGDYEGIINKLILEPPNDYDSHHNLDNEFSLYLWSKTIGLELAALKKEIESGLYFKWWSLKNKIEIDRSVGKFDESTNSIKDWSGKKVLLIDDQHNKGWHLFFKKLLPTVEVDFLHGDYQKPDQFVEKKNIIDAAIDKIENFDPHVVLLDLRLTDSDNENDKKELTGVKILEKFRESNSLNQGIQFISLSASNKIWNYEELLNKNVSSFIVKKIDIEKSLNLFVLEIRKLIGNKLKDAVYLKRIFCDLNKLKKMLHASIQNHEYEVQKVQLDLAFELINEGIINSRYNNFAFHILFQVLEGFIKSSNVFERIGNEAYVICNDTKVLVRKEFELKGNQREVNELCFVKGDKNQKRIVPNKFKIQTKKINTVSNFLDSYFIVMSVLNIRLGLDANDKRIEKWIKLNGKRNLKTGHGSNDKIFLVDTTEIESFIEFLSFVFDAKNQKETNVNRYVNSFNFPSANFNQPSGNSLGDHWPRQKK